MSYRQTILVLLACAGAVSIESTSKNVWDVFKKVFIPKPLEDAGEKGVEVVTEDIPDKIGESYREMYNWEMDKIVKPAYNDVLKPGYEKVSDGAKEFMEEQGPLTPVHPIVTPL